MSSTRMRNVKCIYSVLSFRQLDAGLENISIKMPLKQAESRTFVKAFSFTAFIIMLGRKNMLSRDKNGDLHFISNKHLCVVRACS